MTTKGTIVIGGTETTVDATMDTVLSRECDAVINYAASLVGLEDQDVIDDCRMWVAERACKYDPSRASFRAFLIRMFRWSLYFVRPKHTQSCVRVPGNAWDSGVRALGISLDDGTQAAEDAAQGIIEPQCRQPDEAAQDAEIAARIRRAVDRLTAQERAVMIARAPIMADGGHATHSMAHCSYRRIGESMGVSKQRAKQIHDEAVAKMRSELTGFYRDLES